MLQGSVGSCGAPVPAGPSDASCPAVAVLPVCTSVSVSWCSVTESDGPEHVLQGSEPQFILSLASQAPAPPGWVPPPPLTARPPLLHHSTQVAARPWHQEVSLLLSPSASERGSGHPQASVPMQVAPPLTHLNPVREPDLAQRLPPLEVAPMQ